HLPVRLPPEPHHPLQQVRLRVRPPPKPRLLLVFLTDPRLLVLCPRLVFLRLTLCPPAVHLPVLLRDCEQLQSLGFLRASLQHCLDQEWWRSSLGGRTV